MKRVIFLITVLVAVLPFVILAFMVQLRLFSLAPALWITFLFFRGIVVKPNEDGTEFLIKGDKNE